MIKKAVIDSISEGMATILIGKEEKESVIPVSRLPGNGTFREGDWIRVEVAGERVTVVGRDDQESARVKNRIQEKIERLRSRG